MKKLLILAAFAVAILPAGSCGNASDSTDASDSTLVAPGQEEASADCANYINCDLPECQDNSVVEHRISAARHNKMIEDYYQHIGEPPPSEPYREYDSATIHNMIDTTCHDHRLVYDLDTLGLILTYTPEAERPRPATEKNSYSLGLFKGIFAKYPATTKFRFSRAKREDGFLTMVIQALDAGNTPFYHADLSDAYPGQPSNPQDTSGHH
jgi:hypothetical protein